MWVAKCSDNLGRLFDYELSPRFKDIYECQKYIDENLQVIEFLLSTAFSKIIYGNQWKNGKKQYQICFSGSMIRCYNLSQKRFCTGFDF